MKAFLFYQSYRLLLQSLPTQEQAEADEEGDDHRTGRQLVIAGPAVQEQLQATSSASEEMRRLFPVFEEIRQSQAHVFIFLKKDTPGVPLVHGFVSFYREAKANCRKCINKQ